MLSINTLFHNYQIQHQFGMVPTKHEYVSAVAIMSQKVVLKFTVTRGVLYVEMASLKMLLMLSVVNLVIQKQAVITLWHLRKLIVTNNWILIVLVTPLQIRQCKCSYLDGKCGVFSFYIHMSGLLPELPRYCHFFQHLFPQ